MSSCHNRLPELQQSPSHPHPRIKHDGYGFSTPCLCMCAQAKGLMSQKFGLCCSYRLFDFLAGAADNCSSLSVCFCVSLQVTRFCKVHLTIDTRIKLC